MRIEFFVMRATSMNWWSVAALVLWMGVIYFFSSMPGTVSDSLIPYENLLERKSAHAAEYFMLTLLVFNAFRRTLHRERFGAKMTLVGSLSLLYAFSDEIHQLFVPGREGKLSDVGIDLIGIVSGMVLVGILSKRNIER